MSKWVSAWGVPTSYIEEMTANMLCDTTLRYNFFNPIDGKKIRLRFSNEYGDKDEKIDKVTIAPYSDKKYCMNKAGMKTVTFEQYGNVIKKGGEIFSDEMEFELEAGKVYVISMYIKDPVFVKTGYSKFPGYPLDHICAARGDCTECEELPLETRFEHRNYLFFNSIDVLADDSASAIMAFGDSITARPWPDLLVQRLRNMGITNRSVVRKAIGGNRILRDYQGFICRRRQGVSAIRRFERDLMQVQGCDTVIMLEGTNDLGHPTANFPLCDLSQMPTVEEMIEGYKYICDIAHKHGMKIYLATIMPTKVLLMHPDDRNERRKKVNEWIRNNDVADGFVDFDKATLDPQNPDELAPVYNSGDNLHPSMEGSQKLCDVIPEYMIKK